MKRAPMTSELRLRVARARAEGRITRRGDEREREADALAGTYAAPDRELPAARLHTDPAAAAMAAELGARAFTLGDDVVFGAGQYAPGTPGGRRLLGHELAHVAQARRGGPEVIARDDLDGGVPEDAGASDAADTGSETFTMTDADAGTGDAGVPSATAQQACVAGQGGTAEYRPAGADVSPEDLERYNRHCAAQTGYVGPNVAGSSEAYREHLRTAPMDLLSAEDHAAWSHFVTHGGGTLGGGLLMLGGGIALVASGPVGWVGGVTAALALAGGTAVTATGATQLAAGDSIPEEAHQQANMVPGVVGTMTSPAGLLTTSTALVCGADQQTAFELGGYAAMGEGIGNMAYGAWMWRRQRALAQGAQSQAHPPAASTPDAPPPNATPANATPANATPANATPAHAPETTTVPPPAENFTPTVRPPGGTSIPPEAMPTIPPPAPVPNVSVPPPNMSVPPPNMSVPPPRATVPPPNMSVPLTEAQRAAAAAEAAAARAPEVLADAEPLILRTGIPRASGRPDFGPGQCTTAAAVITLRDLGAIRAQAIIAANARRANAFLTRLYGRLYKRGTFTTLEAQAARKPPGTLVAVSVRGRAARPGEPQFNHMIIGRVGEDGTLTFRHGATTDFTGPGGVPMRASEAVPVSAEQLTNYAVHATPAGPIAAEMRWRFLTPGQQRKVIRALGIHRDPNRSQFPINE